MPDTTTDLQPIDRARSVLAFDTAKAELAELATASHGITEITNKAGYDQCHAARMVLKNRRIAIQRTGKDAREDAQAYSRAVIAVEKELVAIIEPEEGRLAAMQENWDTARERERQAAERAEAERIQRQQDALATITGALGKLFGASAEQLNVALEQLASFDMDQFDDVFRPAAEQARDEATAAITTARDERLELDRQAAALREKQEKLDAERAEQERIAAEQAEARRQQQEAEDRARAERQAEEDRQREEARKAEQAQLDEQRRQLEAQRIEQERIEQEAARQRQEAAEREAAERLEQERAEAQRAAEASAQAEEQAIAYGTLAEAATETLPYLLFLALAGDTEASRLARRLEAALTRETQA